MLFPQTHASVLERVRSADADVRRIAFDDLAAGYWKPSYHYLRLQWKLAPGDAEDAVQAFFTTAFEKQYLEKYDASQSKFRTFLRVCLDRFVQNLRKAEQAVKRGGGVEMWSLDFPAAERELNAMAAADLSDADRFFHDETVRFLFGRAVASLRQQLEAEGRAAVFGAFDRHDLNPARDTSYASVAADLGLSVSQVTNHLHLARKLFRDHALAHLRSISATQEEFEREARELFGVTPAE